MLNALGFSQKLKRIGKQQALLTDPDEDDDTYDLDALVDYLVEERLRQRVSPSTNGAG
jgi:hypothetical protein